MNQITIQILRQIKCIFEVRQYSTKYEININYYSILAIFVRSVLAREQYPWHGSFELTKDVDLLLKQGLKIGYLPKTPENGMILRDY